MSSIDVDRIADESRNPRALDSPELRGKTRAHQQRCCLSIMRAAQIIKGWGIDNYLLMRDPFGDFSRPLLFRLAQIGAWVIKADDLQQVLDLFLLLSDLA